MELQQLANIAEIFGMIVVAITLVFLTAQMRENTRATRSANASTATELTATWYFHISNNPQSSALFWHYLDNPDALTAEERFQAILSLHGLFLSFQNSFYLSRQGTLDAEIRQSLTEVIVAVKHTPGMHHFWRARKSIFFKEFQEHIDGVLAAEYTVAESLYGEVGKPAT
jgi:hypothetical protein